jgi:hypothetical protein
VQVGEAADEYCPRGHVVQSPAAVAPSCKREVPAGQSMQAPEPVEDWYLPAAQGWHWETEAWFAESELAVR